ncbi:MAG: hypothetical protein HUJ69_08350 [Lachnospiraceae bacterium]|nr:hypothetical protein [Lachnospiraceae bacterium]
MNKKLSLIIPLLAGILLCGGIGLLLSGDTGRRLLSGQKIDLRIGPGPDSSGFESETDTSPISSSSAPSETEGADSYATITLSLGNTTVPADASSLTLAPEDFDPEILKAQLPYLTNLKELYLTNTDLTQEQIKELQAFSPDLTVCYSLSLFGEEIPWDASSVDLSSMKADQIQEAVSVLERLPNLEKIILGRTEDYYKNMAESGSGESAFALSSLTPREVCLLKAQLPGIFLDYGFLLFGKPVSTADERIDFEDQYIGDEGEEELRTALTILTGCTYMKLEDCGFSSPVLADVREDFREQTQIVWRVRFGEIGSCLTDTSIIRLANGMLLDNNCSELYYCEGAEYIDFGHDDYLSDCSFVAGMPHLKAAIFSGSEISDISAFANCKELEFLEIAYCSYVKDISALAECPLLNYLNLAFTGVKDLSPVDHAPLLTMSAPGGRIPTEERIRFMEVHPDCLVLFEGDTPYGYPWRYKADGSFSDYYRMLRQIFDYDHPKHTTE